MPKSGVRLWLLALIIATATMFAAGYFLRMRWPVAIADPVAQALGFTMSFIVAWPWFREHNPRRLGFGLYLGVVAVLAAVVAVLRINYLA